MQEKPETSENKNLPAIRGFKLEDSVAPELPALAAGLVHEVKNPLAAIHLHLQLLENYIAEVDEDTLRQRLQSKVGLIKNEIVGLNDTLHEFLRLVRPEKKSSISRFNLDALLQNLLEFLAPQADKERIELQYEPGLQGEIDGADQVFVKQIALNLILNSMQAIAREDREENERRIIVSTGLENRTPWFRVSDTGPGIEPDVLEKIFDPFYTTKETGNGLGLALVNRMIQEMGGQVDVVSNPGKGTEFTVYLKDQNPESGESTAS